MYRLICQKPAHFLSAQMALVSTFFQMFIVLGMYNFDLLVKFVPFVAFYTYCKIPWTKGFVKANNHKQIYGVVLVWMWTNVNHRFRVNVKLFASDNLKDWDWRINFLRKNTKAWAIWIPRSKRSYNCTIRRPFEVPSCLLIFSFFSKKAF